MVRVTRRGFSAAAGASALAGVATTAQARPPLPLGVQLWTVKDALDADFDGTLRRLRSLGYRRVEAAGLHGRTPQAFRAAVERAGLVCDSAHYNQAELEADTPARLAEAKALGLTWIVCSALTPSTPPVAARPGEDWMDQMRRAMTLADYRRSAAVLDRVGGRAAEAGLQLAYHNHAFEFADYDGVEGFAELMRLTDPRRVKCELDLGWVAAGGRDPAAVIRRYGDRTALLHLKDLASLPRSGAPADYTTVAIGRGVLDWPAIFRAARAAGVRGSYVEQEKPYLRPVFDSLADSARFLSGLSA